MKHPPVLVYQKVPVPMVSETESRRVTTETTTEPDAPPLVRKHVLCGYDYARYTGMDLPPVPGANVAYEVCCECGQESAYLLGSYPGLAFSYCTNLLHPRPRAKSV